MAMLTKLHYLPIKLRLIISMVSLVLVIIISYSLITITNDINRFETQLTQETQVAHQVLSQDFIRLLLTDKVEVAAEIITKLESFPMVLHTDLWNNHERLILSFNRTGNEAIFTTNKKSDTRSIFFISEHLSIKLPLVIDKQTKGEIHYLISTEKITHHLLNIYQIILITALGGCIFAILGAIYLQRFFTQPLIELIQKTNAIAGADNYPLRIKENVLDKSEIGILQRSFNNMLTQIEAANAVIYEQKNRLEVTLSSIADALIITDNNGQIMSINETAAILTGWSQTQAQGQALAKVFQIINIESQVVVDDPVSTVLKTQKTVGSANHTTLLSRNGQKYQIKDNAAPIKDSDDKILGVILVFHDVTEQYENQRKIEESEQRLRLTLDATSDGVKDWNIITGEIIFSDKWCQTLGYHPDEISSNFEFWLTLLHPDDKAATLQAINDHLNQKTQTYEHENRLRKKSGEYRYNLARGRVVAWTEDGKPERMIGTDIDITQRKQAELAIIEQRSFLQRVIDSDPNFIFVKDKDSRFVLVNQAVADAYGTSINNLIGKTDTDFNTNQEETDHFHQDDLDVILNQQEKFIPEEKITLANGEIRWLQTIKRPLKIDHHDVDYLLGVASDITERKQIEHDLAQRTHQLLTNQKVLLALAKQDFPDQQSAFKKITATAAEQLLVARVSIWLFNQEHTQLICQLTYQQGQIIDQNCTFAKADFPRYFQALETAGHLTADDALNNPDTQELKNNFLIPLGITSLLDIPIYLGGKIIGIICHAQMGSEKIWTVEDEDFATSMADLCALAIAATERKRSHEQLNKLSRAVEASSVAIVITDQDLNIEFVNLQFTGNSGLSKQEALGKNLLDLSLVEAIDTVHTEIMTTITTGNIWKGELHNYKKDGNQYWSRTAISCVKDEASDKITHFISIQEDITREYELAKLLTYQASHDALTGLINRREFERRATRLLATIKFQAGEHALCFMDLDQFKVINDTCGHTAGDELLRQLGQILEKAVRKRDTLARLGGDEFAVLMEHCSINQAHRAANAIQKAIQDFNFTWQEHSFRLGVSMGLVAVTKSTPNLTELLKKADIACYMAKEKGRNRIHIYHMEDTEIAQRHGETRWVTRLQKSLAENQFILCLQPIIPIQSNKGKHYEFLLRIQGSNGEIIPPGAFLPAAERYDLITQIDRWVITNAFQLLTQHSDFLEQVAFCSINVSGKSLTDDTFLDFVLNELETTGLNGHKICFEITETAAIANLSIAAKFIAQLKLKGCRFALDDFGSGLSSFGYLKNLLVDYLKIDGMFVRDIVDDPIDLAIVKSINEVGHVMGMKTIAEFVENAEIESMLKTLGVDYAQGYYYAEPKPFLEVVNETKNS